MSVLRKRLLTTVIVTLKSGESFRGALWQRSRDAWVLRNAELVRAEVDETPTVMAVDGELLLLTENIAYAQRPVS